MRTATGIRRLRAERRLFEVHAHLAHARDEVAQLACRHAHLARLAEAARLRTAAAETPRAQRAFEDARRAAAVAGERLATARGLVAELERAHDEALDELLAPGA